MFLKNKNGKKFLLASMLFLMLLFSLTVQAHASWVQNEDGTYSYQDADGELARSRWIDKRYYVDADGIRLTGKQKIGAKWYYFSPSNGRLQKKCWIEDGDDRYYAGKDGALYAKGIYTINGSRYLFGANAVMKTGKCTFQKKTYFLQLKDGRMLTDQWVQLEDGFYYFDKSGAMLKNKWLSNLTYYVDGNGCRVSGKWVGSRYIGKNGKAFSGLRKVSGVYYYFNTRTHAKVTNAFVTVSGKRWYFNNEGVGSQNTVPAPGKGVNVQPQYYTHPAVDDETLLSYIIYCEAGNQPYAGKLAIGYVIMNRVYSRTFTASTVREVIYDRGQFSPVWNSSMDKVYSNPSIVNEECRKAAKAVMKRRARFAAGKTVKLNLNGTKTDFPYLYFLSPGGYSSQGMSSAYLQIGDHVFFSSWG